MPGRSAPQGRPAHIRVSRSTLIHALTRPIIGSRRKAQRNAVSGKMESP